MKTPYLYKKIHSPAQSCLIFHAFVPNSMEELEKGEIKDLN